MRQMRSMWKAAREALRFAGSDEEYRADAMLLLRRLDNDRDRAQELLAGLLASRNRWQPMLLENRPEELADRVSASLQRIAEETLLDAHRSLTPELIAEAAVLACSSAQHRRDAGHGEGTWSAWLQPDASLGTAAANLAAWQAVAGLVLKADGEPRQKVDVRLGFPATEKPLKQRWQSWMQQLPGTNRRSSCAAHGGSPATRAHRPGRARRTGSTGAADAAGRHAAEAGVPRARAGGSQRGIRGSTAGAARHGWTRRTSRIRQTLRVRHLLVDEFQDTSPEQLDLVRGADLLAGMRAMGARCSWWAIPCSRSTCSAIRKWGCSCSTRSEGIGDIGLRGAASVAQLPLACQQLVEWANQAFRQRVSGNRGCAQFGRAVSAFGGCAQCSG